MSSQDRISINMLLRDRIIQVKMDCQYCTHY